jgi:tRNA-specific 2-thiouridylase
LKAIALFSGGLDSALAIKLIQDQNIEIEALYIDIGFEANREKKEFLTTAAEKLGVIN